MALTEKDVYGQFLDGEVEETKKKPFLFPTSSKKPFTVHSNTFENKGSAKLPNFTTNTIYGYEENNDIKIQFNMKAFTTFLRGLGLITSASFLAIIAAKLVVTFASFIWNLW